MEPVTSIISDTSTLLAAVAAGLELGRGRGGQLDAGEVAALAYGLAPLTAIAS
jgi:hypothetical protein